VSVKTVDTYLSEAAVLAVVFCAYSWLEIQTFCKTGRLCYVKGLRVDNADKVRGEAAFRFATIG
jgi:hypothetical protein